MNRRLAYAQLLRIPNVFTAISDIAIGLLFTRPSVAVSACIILASASMYCAGMVWNDFFDRHVDALERPMRPIPSGRISASQVARLGIVLVVAGLVAAFFASLWHDGSFHRPFPIALALLICILGYDTGLKNALIGPLVMGGCRSLNVLLGFSAVALGQPAWCAATIVGVYIVGVTVFARDEVEQSRRLRLLVGSSMVVAASIASLALPQINLPRGWSWMIPVVVTLIVSLGIVIAKAMRHPTPQNVQAMVKTAIMGVIVLDAALATSLVGPVGLLLLLLLIPARVLGRWVYST